MSRFMNPRFDTLEAYVPGEQPNDRKYIRLNTNESPFPPSPEVLAAVTRQELESLCLYPDAGGRVLHEKLAGLYGVAPEQIMLTNGSDDVLNFSFLAFGANGAVFPEITYSFYPIFCDLHGVQYRTIPLNEDYSVNVEEFCRTKEFTVIPNPNAPTTLALSRDEIERICAANPDRVLLVDEAYVDFGAESAVPLLAKYDNLLVSMTYSKSRSMAGARLGFVMGSRELIADLEKIRCSTNPYNVNSLTLRMGEAAVDSDAYFRANAEKIIAARTQTIADLRELGFFMPDSMTNFLFVRHDKLDGDLYYRKLKERGILVRHFSDPRIAQFNRVTVGTAEEMAEYVAQTREIMREEGIL